MSISGRQCHVGVVRAAALPAWGLAIKSSKFRTVEHKSCSIKCSKLAETSLVVIGVAYFKKDDAICHLVVKRCTSTVK
jgi:hypothetical protein